MVLVAPGELAGSARYLQEWRGTSHRRMSCHRRALSAAREGSDGKWAFLADARRGTCRASRCRARRPLVWPRAAPRVRPRRSASGSNQHAAIRPGRTACCCH
eukprot:1744837-Pyramimonas_sp.AAC.1